MKRYEHGGDVWRGNPNDWLDFSSNINPYGCPDFIRQAMLCAMDEVAFYPQVNMDRAISGLSKMLSIQPKCILPTNGGIGALDLAITKYKPSRVVVVSPAFVEYERIASVHGIPFMDISMLTDRQTIVFPLAQLEREIKQGDMLIVCNPNNPTGYGVECETIKSLLELTAHRQATLLVDEAFTDFCDELSVRDWVQDYANLIIAGSLTKMFAIPGVRIGYLLADQEVISALKLYQTPWVLSAFASSVAASVGDAQAFMHEAAAKTSAARLRFKAALQNNGLFVYESCANYLMVDMKAADITTAEMSQKLREYHILVRDCENYRGLDAYHMRIAVKSAQDNKLFIKKLKHILKGTS